MPGQDKTAPGGKLPLPPVRRQNRFRPGVGRGKNLKPALPGQNKTTPEVHEKRSGSFFVSCFTDWFCGRRCSPPAPSRTGSKVKTGNSPVREGAAPPPCQRPPQNARRKSLRKSNAFRQSPLSGQDATDRNPRRPWEPPCGSNAAKLDDGSWGAGGGAKRPSRLRRSRNGAGSLSQAFHSHRVRSRQAVF